MAAVTVTKRYDNVMGSRRSVGAIIAGTGSGDTWNTGLKSISSWSMDAGSANPPTAITASGGTLTITAGGSYTGASVIVWGY